MTSGISGVSCRYPPPARGALGLPESAAVLHHTKLLTLNSCVGREKKKVHAALDRGREGERKRERDSTCARASE